MRRCLNPIVVCAAALLALLGAISADAGLPSDHVQVHQSWARALPKVAPNGAAYLTVKNVGSSDVRIVGAFSPMAKRAELHIHSMENGFAKMRRADEGVVVPAHGIVKFAPGGLHLMLMELQEPLTAGNTFPVTLRFDDGGSKTLIVQVLSGQDAMTMGEVNHAHGHGSAKHGEHGTSAGATHR
ncbi:MAG: copper(I)-binding protein [Gammaproteobacteria bacterium]